MASLKDSSNVHRFCLLLSYKNVKQSNATGSSSRDIKVRKVLQVPPLALSTGAKIIVM